MKRKIGIVLVLLTMISLVGNSYVYGYNDDNTLDLNTEELKNKKEDYSSLTDINGIAVFTNDMKDVINKQNFAEEQKNDEIKNTLFTDEFSNDSQDGTILTSHLFSQPVSFDKQQIQSSSQDLIIPFVIGSAIVLGVIVFIITKRKYSRKEQNDNEVDYDIFK